MSPWPSTSRDDPASAYWARRPGERTLGPAIGRALAADPRRPPVTPPEVDAAPIRPRTYAVRTFGCQMNEHDSERAAGILEAVGYRRATDPLDADLVLLNTCAVRENADERLYGTLGHLKGMKDARRSEGRDLTIVVGGCLAQKDGATVAERAPWVDVVYGTHNLGNLPDLLARADADHLPVVELLETLEVFPSALPAQRGVRHHAWVSISVGCDNTCSFCIVPALRGPERSRTVAEILAEVRGLVADDVVEVTLLGQNVNSYGRDIGGRALFADLLRTLGDVEGLERVRFTSPHPRDFTVDVLEAMAETANVMPHLHLPLQSGSDRILRDMRRSYRRERYLDLVDRTRALLPDASLTTDIIVGFPGETEEDFLDTMDVVERVRFDQAFTFQYSPRPGTDAAEMVDRFVDPDEVAHRYRRLEERVRAHSVEAHQRLVGTEVELLIEGPSRTDASRWSGRDPANHLVHLPAPEPALPFHPGDLVTATVRSAATGYALADVAQHVRRTRAGRAAAASAAAGAPTVGASAAPSFLSPTLRRLPVVG
jgi:tRNA-2-methylthio-N6-dimethylallyladenosine synthase